MYRGLAVVALAGSVITLGVGTALADDTPDATRAYAAGLRADAASRAIALGQGENETTVKLGGWAQFRYYLNFRDDPASTSAFHDSGFTNGFETTKTRLQGTGSIMSKDLTYKIEGEFSKSGGGFSLLDAFANHKFDESWSSRIGQFKLPILREETISDTYQLTVNRSVANDIFSQKRSHAVQLGYQTDAWQFRADVSDGLNSLNTDYTNPTEADYAVTARVDIKGGGTWKDFDQFTNWRGNSNMWLLGVAVHYQHDGNTAASPPVAVQQQRIMYTMDFGYYGNGWNFYAAGIGRHLDPDSGGSALDDFGAVVQGGIFVSDHHELFARWSGVFADSSRTNDDVFNEITAGMNWFPFVKTHAVKFTGDVVWFPNATTSNDLVAGFAASNNIGLRPSSEDNQFAVRLQFQWVF